MKYLLCLLVCIASGRLAAADEEPQTFDYDASGLRDPMSRKVTPAPSEAEAKDESATEASRLADIQRVVAAARIEGVAVGPFGRYVIINDRVVGEGEAISAEYDVRVAKIEPQRITFTLDTQALTYILTPPEEETLP
jgi:hypothetical protein